MGPSKMTSNIEVKEEVSKIVAGLGYSLKELILFGSRAKGTSSKNSDWDLLVIINEKTDIATWRIIAKAIREKFADYYLACDAIVKSADETEYYKNYIGSVVREAYKEGVAL
jgi:predicted nucleotidyltransferase